MPRYSRSFRTAIPRTLRGQRGQLLIPFLLVVPSLLIFIFLVIETAKLSREKIRHQFAVDAAAYIEMSNYTELLNQAAYVNGAYPKRLFEEAFHDICIQTRMSTQGTLPNHCGGVQGDRLYEILRHNGAFPADEGGGGTIDEEPTWKFKYSEKEEDRNQPEPNLGAEPFRLITKANSDHYRLTFDDATNIFNLYWHIYKRLGGISESQYEIFCNLTGANGCAVSDGRHRFYRKSYWLNSADPSEHADDGVRWFQEPAYAGFDLTMHCIQQMLIYGIKPSDDPFKAFETHVPSQLIGGVKTVKPIDMPAMVLRCQPAQGLFQLVTVKDDDIENLKKEHAGSPWPGYPVTQHWDIDRDLLSRNYFNIDFHEEVKCRGGGGPCVHATVGVANPSEEGLGLWPNPTPKFHTRLYP
ncbi:MAG: hypothetical protein ABIJ96_04300 [Elusimicrobiota bacterium]